MLAGDAKAKVASSIEREGAEGTLLRVAGYTLAELREIYDATERRARQTALDWVGGLIVGVGLGLLIAYLVMR